MPSDPADTSTRALTEWLKQNDWALYEAATTAVESESALKDGVSAVKKSQLRAIVNTARMCSSPSQFRGFLKKRAERRDAAGQDQKAKFWGALKSHLNDVEETHAAPAVEQAGIPDSRADAAQMRVIRTYFEHLVSHCQVVEQ